MAFSLLAAGLIALAAAQDPGIRRTGVGSPVMNPIPDGSHLDVCFNPVAEEFFLLFRAFSASSPMATALFGLRIDGRTGSPVGVPFELVDYTPGVIVDPVVIHSPINNRYVVAYSLAYEAIDGRTLHRLRLQARNGDDPRYKALGSDGLPVGEVAVDDGLLETDQCEANLAVTPVGVLVVWRRTAFLEDDEQISSLRFRKYRDDGVSQGNSFPLGTGSGDAARPRLATMGATHLLVYAESLLAGFPRIMKSCLLAADGGLNLGSVRTLSASAGNHDWPQVAANPVDHEWLVVWERNNRPDSRPGEPGVTGASILYRRLAADGIPSSPEQALPNEGALDVAPAAVWRAQSGSFVVHWQRGSIEAGGDIVGLSLPGGTGITSGIEVIAGASHSEATPVLASDPASGHVLGAWIATDGQSFLDTESILLVDDANAGDGGGGGSVDLPPADGGSEARSSPSCGASASAGARLLLLGVAAGVLRRRLPGFLLLRREAGRSISRAIRPPDRLRDRDGYGGSP